MILPDRRTLKQEAARALGAAAHPKKIVAVYAGVSVGMSLILLLLDMLLRELAGDTGGLSNFDNMILLETVRSVLPYVQLAVLICWELGFWQAMVRIARGEEADERTLLEGFRIWGPALRAYLFQGAIYIGLLIVSSYVGSLIFAFTPLAAPLMAVLEPVMADIAAGNMTVLEDEALLMAMTEAMIPAMCIMLALFLVAVVFVSYRYRMVNLCLLENPRAGALAAMRSSRAMMRGNCWKLAKLDLSFWWYYALILLAGLLGNLDILLPMFGLALPLSPTVSLLVFCGLNMAAMFGVYCFAHNRVQQTYTQAYEALRPRPRENGGAVLGNIFQM